MIFGHSNSPHRLLITNTSSTHLHDQPYRRTFYIATLSLHPGLSHIICTMECCYHRCQTLADSCARRTLQGNFVLEIYPVFLLVRKTTPNIGAVEWRCCTWAENSNGLHTAPPSPSQGWLTDQPYLLHTIFRVSPLTGPSLPWHIPSPCYPPPTSLT